MTLQVIGFSILIFIARITDVSLGTLRTVAVIHGRKGAAWFLGFSEVLIWVFVVSGVINTVQQAPWYALPYALGFATGNFVGIAIEQYFAVGHQVVRVFTRRGDSIAARLRGEGVAVTEFDGKGRDGPVQMLFIEVDRKSARRILNQARAIDPSCFVVVDDIRLASIGQEQSEIARGKK